MTGAADILVDPAVIAHLSPSSFDQFVKCPAQWCYVRVEGRKMPPGIAAHVGSGLHGAAEASMRQKIVSGVDLPGGHLSEVAAEAYKAKIERDGVFIPRDEQAGARQAIADGVGRAAGFARAWGHDVAPDYQPAAVEERTNLEDAALPIPWVGIVDLRTADDRLVDWKTAGRRWPAGREARETQGTVYWRLFRAITGREPREVAFDVLAESKAGPVRDRRPTERDADDWAALQRSAAVMLRMIAAGLYPPATSGSWWCGPRWCGFWWTCEHISERLRRLPNVG